MTDASRQTHGPAIVRFADLRETRWKNGGGLTMEVAAYPETAGLDEFGWRVSFARVTAAGPFSDFPGVDRTLTVVDGSGLDLTIGTAPVTRLDRASDPLSFPADAPCLAALTAGPVLNFNVMSRRGQFRHAVVRSRVVGALDVTVQHVALVTCLDRVIAIEGELLSAFDTLVVRSPGAVTIHAERDTAALLTTFAPARPR